MIRGDLLILHANVAFLRSPNQVLGLTNQYSGLDTINQGDESSPGEFLFIRRGLYDKEVRTVSELEAMQICPRCDSVKQEQGWIKQGANTK
jgi:hypothetical protein